ncbi:MAG: hypothetical protein WBC44_02740 [Planctomycetaceae bacterium]
MISITVGSDTYGSVKRVGGTRIVTQFAMLNGVPLYPLASFYCAGAGPMTATGLPFVFSVKSASIVGLPLARIDRFSTTMAYVRGLCGTLVVIGFLSIVPIVMHLSGERLDDFATAAMIALMCSFLIGCIGGGMSYLIPLGVSERDQSIRLWCGRILGIEADPAAVRADVVEHLAEALSEAAEQEEIDSKDDRLAQELTLVRLKIALGDPPEALETRTDRLLERLGLATGDDAKPYQEREARQAIEDSQT